MVKGHLKRHILNVHRYNDCVIALQLQAKSEQKAKMALMKKEGILKENKSRLKQIEATRTLLRERKQSKNDKLSMCSKCNGFYKSSLLCKHTLKCSAIVLGTPNDGVEFAAQIAVT
jgi:hypothetical protein